MRQSIDTTSFIGGIVAGLAAVGVTLLTIETARRVRAIRGAHAAHADNGMRWLDGAHPVPETILATRPQHEGNATPNHLASEAVDAPPTSQRW